MQTIMQARVGGGGGIHHHQPSSSFCQAPIIPRGVAVVGLSRTHGRSQCRQSSVAGAASPSASASGTAVSSRRDDLSSSSLYSSFSPFRASLAGVERRRPSSLQGRKLNPVEARFAEQGVGDNLDTSRRAQVSKRLERTAGYFRRLGSIGFWGQLICTVVSAIILAFSVVVTGAATSPITLYLTAAGIVAAFLSVFWSFGYIRLSQRLRQTIDDPTKAPPRAQVVRNLKNGIIINILGMGSTLVGLQSTVGVLVAKALTSSAQPFLQGQSPGYSPVLALDVFIVQASANALVSHFLGMVFSLELLRSVTLSQPPPDGVLPKPA